MNILFLIDPNSIHDQKWIVKFTSDRNYRCFFICRKIHFEKNNIRSFEKKFKISFEGVVDYFSYKKIFKSLRQVKQIKDIIRKHNIHIFHIQYAEPNALWTLFRRYMDVPIIITCRGTDVLKTIPEHFSKHDVFNKLISKSYKIAFHNADWVTFTSSSQLNSVVSFCGKLKNKSIIRTGVDLEKLYSDTSISSQQDIKKPYILFPRYIKPIYNHEFTIEALKLLPSKLKHKYKMVFVGKDSGEKRYQDELIQQLNEDPLIDYTFFPKLTQAGISELYKKSSLIIMTPKSDGSPVSGMEAVALNKKLILGPLEYDEDIFSEPNVFFLKSWSTSELSALIETVINKKPFINKPSVEYLSRIDSNLNMEKLGNIYKQLAVGT